MGVKVEFKSGKSASFRNSTGFKFNENETFKRQDGTTYKSAGYVIFFGKGRKSIHYRASQVKDIYDT